MCVDFKCPRRLSLTPRMFSLRISTFFVAFSSSSPPRRRNKALGKERLINLMQLDTVAVTPTCPPRKSVFEALPSSSTTPWCAWKEVQRNFESSFTLDCTISHAIPLAGRRSTKLPLHRRRLNDFRKVIFKLRFMCIHHSAGVFTSLCGKLSQPRSCFHRLGFFCLRNYLSINLNVNYDFRNSFPAH